MASTVCFNLRLGSRGFASERRTYPTEDEALTAARTALREGRLPDATGCVTDVHLQVAPTSWRQIMPEDEG
jgi:hypothetical protein